MSRDALVVGINTYSYERLNNLTAPARDAEAVAQLLEKYGEFKVTRLPAVKDKQNDTIRVGQKTKVTLIQLEDAIVKLFKPAGKPPDTALLYFSGHGLRKSRGIQEGFLASSDINPDMGNWGVRLKWLRELLQESEVRQQIIILDCCYAGEVLNVAEADPGDRGKGRDRCFIAASRSFEVAYEEISSQHSVLTAALIKGLEPQQERWVTNYTLIDLLNQEQNAFSQRPIFGNSGEAINLTRRWTAVIKDSAGSAQAICPYKGLNYFDCNEGDTKYFYGRTALTDELLEKVRVGNFLAVLGASGSGKSSVLRAGLLYQLKLGRRLSGSQSWQIKIFQPGEHPLYSLALAFLDPELPDIQRAIQLAQKVEELKKSGSESLIQLIATADKQRVVLLIDQFEEVFTLCKDTAERQQFFECLLGALPKTGDKLCLVLTMRADFFGKCIEQEYSGLAQQIQHNLVPVTAMSQEDLRQAIVEPAKQVQLEIEPELVEVMLTDVANAPGYLPLLQYTLTQLWSQRMDNCLRLNTYVQLGRVMGTLGKRATQVYESFSEKEQVAVRHIFLELTQLGEGTEDTRRQVLKQDLVNQNYSEDLIDTVVQRLADEKLVVTSEIISKGSVSQRVAVVDVAHEALIRNWTLLHQWIDQNREKLSKRRANIAMIEELRGHGGLKLSGLDFSGLDFSGLDLSRADLRGTKLNNADLTGANLSSAYLEGAYLSSANLTGVYFSSADLTGANLSSANLEGANFAGGYLRGAYLEGAYLEGAYLEGGNLRGANLRGVYLREAYLREADLNKADLEDANLEGANLRGANLEGANLRGANLEGANLAGVYLRERAYLSFTNLGEGANFRGTDLRGANLEGANLRGANLEGANLAGVYLREGANLSFANLREANLREANLREANLREANLREANLRDANLRDAKNLTPEQIKSAKNWQLAVYDENFRAKLGLPPEK